MEAIVLAVSLAGILAYENLKKDKKTTESFDPKPIKKSTSERSKNLESNPNVNRNDLLDMNNRTIDDFKNNYFIPNTLRNTQNMVGTGVQNGFLTGYNTGQLNPDTNQFGNDSESAFLPVLNKLNYTGDKTFRHKRETGPLFTPSEQADRFVQGTPLIRHDLDRFKQDMRFKPDEVPFQPVRVGPGLNLDPSKVAEGGFNAGLQNRIMPTNLFNYESNQLGGGINIGKHHAVEMPTSLPGNIGICKNNPDIKYGVPQNKPDTFWTDDRIQPVPYGSANQEAIVEYSAQSGPLKTGLKRKNNLYGFGEIKPN